MLGPLRRYTRCNGPSRSQRRFEDQLKELIRTTDVALVSAIEALLSEAGIPYQVFDRHVRVMEGSIGIFPLRVVVPEEYLAVAAMLIEDAELGDGH